MPTQNTGFKSLYSVSSKKKHRQGSFSTFWHSLKVFSTNRMAWIWRTGVFCANRQMDNDDNDTTDHFITCACAQAQVTMVCAYYEKPHVMSLKGY